MCHVIDNYAGLFHFENKYLKIQENAYLKLLLVIILAAIQIYSY